MKQFLILLAIVLIPGGIVIGIGKWIKWVREYSYPDIDFEGGNNEPYR